jgi:hypothetical protein
MKAAWVTIFIGSLLLGLGGCGPELPPPGPLLYKGKVLKVFQTQQEIVVQNIYSSPVAIRVSWDRKDHDGVGKGGDSFIDDLVEPNEWVTGKFIGHTSVQIWAWGTTGALVDSVNLSVGGDTLNE